MRETPRAINIETKSQLARLLAKEDITVTVGNYSTAFFDIKNRELGIPNWDFSEKAVLDLLIGHEVGHALYTPQDGINLFKERFPKAPFDICNIIEDIRIERIIQDTYPGLIHAFKKGYAHFVEEDLFAIKDKDVSKLSFADRLNIRAKTRNVSLVHLDDEEELFYNKCLKAESYEEVLDLCEELIEKIEDEPEQEPADPNPEDGQDVQDGQDGGNETGDNEDGDDLDETPSNEDFSDSNGDEEDSSEDKESNKVEGDSNGDPSSSDSSDSPSSEPSNNKDFEDLVSETQKALEDSISENNKNDEDTLILKTPSAQDFLDCVVPFEEIRLARKNGRNYQSNLFDYNPEKKQEWLDFKSETKKGVSILLKEFERRKAAFQYSRSAESTSGSIDVNKLFSYKYDDKIFKTVTTLANAKSHGMLFFIDYSGSMSRCIRDVIRQTIVLANFCYSANIPFEVYGFTTPQYLSKQRQDDVNTDTLGWKLQLRHQLQLFELLNSKLKKNDFEKACEELYVQCLYNSNTFNSVYENLGGTPLTECLIAAHHISKRFKKKNPIQKATIMFLSDGEGQPVSIRSSNIENEVSNTHSSWKCNKIMNVNGKNINIQNFWTAYPELVESLRKAGNTVIGFFVAGSPKHKKNHIVNSIQYSSLKVDPYDHADSLIATSRKKKEKLVSVDGGYGYDNYYILDSNSLKNKEGSLDDEEFEVGDLSKARDRNKIFNKFKKKSDNKKTQKSFLTKFAEVIS